MAATGGDNYEPQLTLKGLAANWPAPARAAFGTVVPALDRVFGLAQLSEIYRRVTEHRRPCASSVEFIERVHTDMGVKPLVREESLRRVPKTGPLVVVANHPYGGIEATVLLSVLSSIRPDVKFMANFMLGSLAETQDFCIYVDPFGGDGAARKNLQPLRETIDWVKKGGVLCIFPSGTVSHFHWRNRQVTDPKWNTMVGRVIRKTAAPVIPIFFPGSNGLLFQSAGVIHPLLRTILLPREFLNKQNREIRLKVGNLIPPSKLNSFATDEELITYLRLRTYILGNEQKGGKSVPMTSSVKTFLAAGTSRRMERIAPPGDPFVMEAEIKKLPPHQLLTESGELGAYYARAKQIPTILRELGRLREISFREVNEGTGKSIDVDHFDSYYTHLFVWNRAKRELVGAYRLAKTDKVLRHFGKNGLYTSTLFAYRTPLLDQIGPAIELGRSFVRHEYQRNYSSLLLLWRGIGQYVLRYPRYRILFGPVSINNEYDSASRELITLFLRANNFLPELARLIKARNPMARTKLVGMDIETTSFVVKDIRDVSDLLQDIESQQKAIPILLKQYLKLGGKLLGFNVDTSFGDVLDGLIFVDMLEADYKLLERYMGREGAPQFLAYYGRSVEAKSAGLNIQLNQILADHTHRGYDEICRQNATLFALQVRNELFRLRKGSLVPPRRRKSSTFRTRAFGPRPFGRGLPDRISSRRPPRPREDHRQRK